MRRLIESGAVRGDRFPQVGLRGYWPEPETLDWMAAEITSFLANRVVLEALSAIARRRRDERDGTRWDQRQPLLDGR